MENIIILPCFIDSHIISREIRSKMIDWMLEVLAVYRSETETFFLSVHIMDTFINQSLQTLRSDDVHLLGVTAMFLASKFEDVIPIRINSFITKISHNVFSEKQIRTKEKKILDVIGFNQLISTSTYEFVKTYFFDFVYNNNQSLSQLNLVEVVEKFESSSIYLARLIMHFEGFYEYK